MELYESVGGKVSTLFSEFEQEELGKVQSNSRCDCDSCLIKRRVLPYCIKVCKPVLNIHLGNNTNKSVTSCSY